MSVYTTVPRYKVQLVRESHASADSQPVCGDPETAYDILAPYFDGLDREHFVALMLDAKHRPIGLHVVSIGHLSGALVHPRETFKAAILANAAAIIVAHNHPSGDPTPSPADISLTQRLVQAGTLLDIPILDHVICGVEQHASLHQTHRYVFSS